MKYLKIILAVIWTVFNIWLYYLMTHLEIIPDEFNGLKNAYFHIIRILLTTSVIMMLLVAIGFVKMVDK
ncbi:hypothetical protein [Dyadobacter diqingensis]|uniref:hypothetical protein n=1 Tax=Dyadobacter diqingensis TaxID=2938121 RepID=UPI0020C21A6C|nr:hypothetical protein [Dyadobacter diqingensis]